MAIASPRRVTADRFIDATLELIAERGGSQEVNLRQIARRVGCAHTNAYNYFASYDDLRWAAFRRALRHYGEYLTHGLEESADRRSYVERVVANLASYPIEHPGWFRFIGSDPIDVETIPGDVLESVGAMKEWLFGVLAVSLGPSVSPTEAARIANIVLAYIDGETLNLINGRVAPGDDIEGRVVENAMRLVEDLSGLDPLPAAPASNRPYPTLDLSGVEGAN